MSGGNPRKNEGGTEPRAVGAAGVIPQEGLHRGKGSPSPPRVFGEPWTVSDPAVERCPLSTWTGAPQRRDGVWVQNLGHLPGSRARKVLGTWDVNFICYKSVAL